MMMLRYLQCVFLLLALGAGSQAWAQYNLRTFPAIPVAGAPFEVSFDDDDCEIFFLGEPGIPPSVVVQGSVVRVEVDHAPVMDCSSDELTYTIPVSGLPAGSYTLQLIGRVFESPGTEGHLESLPLQIVASGTPEPATIPANDGWSLAALVALLAGWAAWRRS